MIKKITAELGSFEFNSNQILCVSVAADMHLFN